MSHWDDEILHDQFRRITENAGQPDYTLRGVMRSIVDLPRGSWRMAKLCYRVAPGIPAADMRAAYAELDSPGRTATEIVMILEHRINEHGSPFRPASDEVL